MSSFVFISVRPKKNVFRTNVAFLSAICIICSYFEFHNFIVLLQTSNRPISYQSRESYENKMIKITFILHLFSRNTYVLSRFTDRFDNVAMNSLTNNVCCLQHGNYGSDRLIVRQQSSITNRIICFIYSIENRRNEQNFVQVNYKQY